jgi:hypothetical protein
MQSGEPLRRFWSAMWLPDLPWPLRILRGVLLLFVLFLLAAAVAWLGFGRNAELEVVDTTEALLEVLGIILLPVLIVGLVAWPLHGRFMNKINKIIGADGAQDRDRQNT